MSVINRNLAPPDLCVPHSALADFTVSTGLVDFGNVALGDSATEVVRLSNRSSGVINDITAGISGKSAGIGIGTCDDCLFPKQGCFVSVTFTPERYGTKKKRLSIDGVVQNLDGSDTEFSVVVLVTGRSDNPSI